VGPEFIRFDREMIRVGRHSVKADVCLSHPGVSRLHAELSVGAGIISVRDLKTPNGVRVNGRRIEHGTLNTGDRVEFGPVTYRVEDSGLKLLTLPGMQLEVSDLAIRRSGVSLLEGVRFAVKANEFVGILGPSGAGKSTLLKCLASFVPAAAGHIEFDGLDIAANLDKFQAESCGAGASPRGARASSQLRLPERRGVSLRRAGARPSRSSRTRCRPSCRARRTFAGHNCANGWSHSCSVGSEPAVLPQVRIIPSAEGLAATHLRMGRSFGQKQDGRREFSLCRTKYRRYDMAS
jgi:energy-coupling factor transporter ATP-binding protein EcfA2